MAGEFQRVFLGWDAPVLAAASSFLLDRGSDLGSTLVVLPGRRSARVLLGMLVDEAARRRQPLVPPATITPAEIPASVLRPTSPPAPPLLRRLAWSQVLREAPAADLDPLIRIPPAPDAVERWAALARILEQVSDELARSLVDPIEVPARAASIEGFNETSRWEAFARLLSTYNAKINESGLIDDGLWTAAALRATPVVTPRSLVLVGVPELTPASRAAIKANAAAGGSVVALVAAPQSESDAFDSLGTVRPEAWIDRPIPLHADRVAIANTPREQGERALAYLATIDPPFAPHEITLGVPDPDLIPALEREAQRAGLPVRRAAGRALRLSPPALLLRALGSYLRLRSFESLITLLRTPEIDAYLRRTLPPLAPLRKQGTPRTEWWLAEIQEYAARSLASSLDAPILAKPASAALIQSVIHAIDQCMAPLREAPASRDPASWAAPLQDLLARLSQGQRLDRSSRRDRPTIDAISRLRDAIHTLSTLPSTLPKLGAFQTIDLLLEVEGDSLLPEPPLPDAAELLGWLELLLDPASALVISGVNEGFLPGGNVADPFLPDTLRRVLGMPTDRARLGRDAYLLRAIVASRPHVFLTSGRRAADATPLRPSRLLVACDPDAAAERILRFADPSKQKPPPVRVRHRLVPGSKTGFAVRPIVPADPLTSMRVTAFRDYLASPYTFYLKHVLRLEVAGPAETELDALAFGSLIHGALSRFGRDTSARDLADPRPIAAYLNSAFEAEFRSTFGSSPSPSLLLQVAAAQRRLAAFATQQAQRRAQGWRIAHAEWPDGPSNATLDVDVIPFGLRGRIDRIDIHEATGRWAILDYKTGDTAKPPNKTHRKGQRWIDLQLPLYRHLIRELNPPESSSSIDLGYVVLCADLSEKAFHTAGWDAAELAAADEAAYQVVRDVRAGRFDTLGDDPPNEGTFAALCGVGFPVPRAEPAP